MMHWSDDGMTGAAAMMGYGGGVLGGLLTLVVFALAVVGVVALVRGWRAGDLGVDGRRARQILDDRFARGEIDTEEYTRQRELLRPHG
jgi:putative membrane protein